MKIPAPRGFFLLHNLVQATKKNPLPKEAGQYDLYTV